MKAEGNVAALISALGKLRPDAPTATRIAELLGLAWASDTEASTPRVSVVPPAFEALRKPAPSPAAVAAFAPQPDPFSSRSATPVSPAARDQRLELRSVSETAVLRAKLPMLTFAEHAKPAARTLPFEPLLRPVVTRTVVSTALARRAPRGSLDLPRLSDLCARRAPFQALPRLSSWSLAGFTRVLIDRGAGMTPFSRDASDLAQRISAVASRERTEVAHFWQSPLAVGPMPSTAAPLPLPRPASAVLAITDLGIAPSGACVPDLFAHWLELEAQLRAAECRLVVFVPYPSRRWPAPLAERLCLVAWDRRTSLADVRSALTRARLGR